MQLYANLNFMKDNRDNFLLTLAVMLLAGFLLLKLYDGKNLYQALKSEYDNYKAQQEEKENGKWSIARYWDFTFQYPRDWHVSLFFTNDKRETKTFAISPYPIDFTRVAYSRGIYELTIYEDPSLFDDEFWQKTQEEYLKDLEYVEPEEIDTPHGHINYYKGKEKQDTAPGQNVEVYFYKFNYPYFDSSKNQEVTGTNYLKLELLYIEDWRITEMMREMALSIKPITQ